MIMKKINYLDKIRKYPRVFLAFAILFSACLIYYQYVFGNSIFLFNDIGADTQQQYIMQYNTIVNHLRSGNFSLWDFSNGFGTSMFQLNMFDPSLILLYLAGVVMGPGIMSYLLIYLHIGKLILAGLMCYQFLSCFSYSRKSILLASYLYAFNGFLMVWGQHYQFSMVCVYLPLYLYVLEKALSKKKFSASLPLLTAFIVMYSYYMGYMILITGGIYLIFRLFFQENLNWKARFRTFFLNCGSMLLGVGMALVTLLPGYAIVSNVSSRLESGTNIFQRLLTNTAPYPLRYYPTLILRFFSSNLEGIGNNDIGMPYRGYNNYYEAPNVFFSTLFVILAVQFLFYLFLSKESKRRKLTQWLLVILSAAALCLMAGSLIFNGFSAPFSRHTFILMPLFALMTAKMADEILVNKYFNIAGAILTALGMTAVYFLAYRRNAATPSAKLNILLLCGSGLIMILLLYLLSSARTLKRLSQTSLYLLLIICAGANIISDSHITARGRSSVSKGSDSYFTYLYGTDIKELTAYLQETDPTFYRLEKTDADASFTMESCAQGYRGISTYNSTINKNIQEFTTRMLPNLNLVNFSRLTYRHILHDDVYATLFGIKYLATTDAEYSSDTYQFLKQFGSLYLYQNRFGTSIGRLFTQTMEKETYEANSSVLDATMLLQSAVITDQRDNLAISHESINSYAKKPLPDFINYGKETFQPNVDIANGQILWNTSVTIPLDSNRLQASGPATMEFDIVTDQPTEINFSTSNGHFQTSDYELTMDTAGYTYHVSLTIPSDTSMLNFVTRYQNINCTLTNVNFTSQSTAAGFSDDSGIIVNNTGTDSRLNGTIRASENSVAFFAIPYEDGWSAALDRKPVELIRLNYGFSGFYVSPGEHEFTLTYRAPMLKEGIILSTCFWVLYFSIVLILRHRTKKETDLSDIQ